MMFDENQLVEMQWNNGTKKWYESKGYVFTKKDDKFFVKAKDLKASSNKTVNVICDYCGKEYQTAYYVFINGRKVNAKDCCHSCCGTKATELGFLKRAKDRFEKIENICKSRNYRLLTTFNEYIDGNTLIRYICEKHGEQMVKANYLCDGSGCHGCRLDALSESHKFDISKVRNIIEEVEGNIWLNPDEYENSSVCNLKIKCRCGNAYITSLSSYIHYNVTKCPKCSNSESKAETTIKTFLINHDILFKQESGFDDCRDINRLPFDFYLPELNVCIEFNGKQHYEIVEYFGGEKGFITRQRHDKIKDEYCRLNNIKLVVIPYWEENNINNILIKQLNL